MFGNKENLDLKIKLALLEAREEEGWRCYAEALQTIAKLRSFKTPSDSGVVLVGKGNQRVFLNGHELHGVKSVTNENLPDSLSTTTIVLNVPYQVRDDD